MWWIFGIGMLFLAVKVVLSLPLHMKFTINTDPFGRNWNMETRLPFRRLRQSGEEASEIAEHVSGLHRLFIIYLRNLYHNAVRAKPKKSRIGSEVWESAFFKSLRFKKIALSMGLKEVPPGEAVFIFGVVTAAIYPFMGAISVNNKGFMPEISFKTDLSGFAFTCIITFTLGQVIHEAGKRYWALWKESRYAG